MEVVQQVVVVVLDDEEVFFVSPRVAGLEEQLEMQLLFYLLDLELGPNVMVGVLFVRGDLVDSRLAPD